MIEDLLPPAVAVAATRTDPPEARLFAEEEAVVAGAVAKRRAEFTTVRHCARTALAGLGVPPSPILRGTRGAPIWPSGIVGSMTHCDGYRAAAVARSADLRAIGIDAEPNESLPPGVLKLVSRPAERDWIADHLFARPGVRWDRLLFSAKESIYKVWFPLTGRWLNFAEAEVTPAGDGTLTARLLVPAPLPALTCRWSLHAGVLTTAIVV